MLEHVVFSLRIRAGLSKHALAKLAQTSVACISLIESGRRTRPQLQTLQRLSAALNADVALLLCAIYACQSPGAGGTQKKPLARRRSA